MVVVYRVYHRLPNGDIVDEHYWAENKFHIDDLAGVWPTNVTELKGLENFGSFNIMTQSRPGHYSEFKHDTWKNIIGNIGKDDIAVEPEYTYHPGVMFMMQALTQSVEDTKPEYRDYHHSLEKALTRTIGSKDSQNEFMIRHVQDVHNNRASVKSEWYTPEEILKY